MHYIFTFQMQFQTVKTWVSDLPVRWIYHRRKFDFESGSGSHPTAANKMLALNVPTLQNEQRAVIGKIEWRENMYAPTTDAKIL